MSKWLIPYGDRTWEFDDTRLTASESRLHKALTGGLSPLAGERARFELDGDAWVAALVIARRRTGMSADDASRVDADEVDLTAALRATRDQAERELRELRDAVRDSGGDTADVDAVLDEVTPPT